ncbi:RNase H family protein [Laspinema olomoucense]|uniref:RNase H type-1 domain-containing protein n=1 Tax=Laspinema olomoucense D3b TaxID=2953688 RepID=A0ABT2N4P9_9CYAN|nr:MULTISPECIES: RNase H family protein [unclassified Laspinema]MCT7977666.1 hypothetical protein [Laspinema sp. D3b]MCT7992511.1 hypothetical protein [Laspinema sp. D3c]
MKQIEVYCDGSCYHADTEKAFGGWGVLIKSEGFPTKMISGHIANNPHCFLNSYHVELKAIIESYRRVHQAVKMGYQVTIYSDCRNFVKTIKNPYRQTPEKYQHLWVEFDKVYLNSRSVKIKWVKGHSGHPENVSAHKLAQQAAMLKVGVDLYIH